MRFRVPLPSSLLYSSFRPFAKLFLSLSLRCLGRAPWGSFRGGGVDFSPGYAPKSSIWVDLRRFLGDFW